MVPVLKLGLTLLNTMILSLFLAIARQHFNSGNSRQSWSVAFYCLSISWLTLRSVFWLLTIVKTSTWNSGAFYVLYYLPNPLQFASFVLLPLFYAQVLHRRRWKFCWWVVRPLYIIVTFGMVSFMTIFSIIASFKDEEPMPVSIGVFVVSYDEHPDSANSANKAHPKISSIFRLIISASFLVLSFLLAFYALKTHRKVRWHHQNSLSISPKNLAGVNFTLFFIFFSRAIYQLGQVLSWWSLPDLNLQANKDLSVLIFLCFIFWDYLPTVLVLLTVTNHNVRELPTAIRSLLGVGGGGSLFMGGADTSSGDHNGGRRRGRMNEQERRLVGSGKKRNIPTYGVFAMIDDDNNLNLAGGLVNNMAGNNNSGNNGNNCNNKSNTTSISNKMVDLESGAIQHDGSGGDSSIESYLDSRTAFTPGSSGATLAHSGSHAHIHGLAWVGSVGSNGGGSGDRPPMNNIHSNSSGPWSKNGLVRGAIFNDEKRYWKGDESDIATPPTSIGGGNSYTNWYYMPAPPIATTATATTTTTTTTTVPLTKPKKSRFTKVNPDN